MLVSTTRPIALTVHLKLTAKHIEKCNTFFCTLMSTVTNESKKKLNPQRITQYNSPITIKKMQAVTITTSLSGHIKRFALLELVLMQIIGLPYSLLVFPVHINP